jgi:hypothetical protein
MQISFNQQEFVAILSSLFKTQINPDEVHFEFDEHTGSVACIKIGGIDAATLLKIGSIAQSVVPTKVVTVVSGEPKHTVYAVETNSTEEDEPPTNDDGLDDVIRVSEQLSQLLPEETTAFPAEFMQGILNKIR